MASGIDGNIEDLKSWKMWRAVVAEFIGTMILVVIGCGTCIGEAWSSVTNPTMVQISLAFGLIVATVVWSIGHVSGGHVNPAVTTGMLVARKISIVRAIFYIIGQSFGGIAGAGVLMGLTPENFNETFGLTTVWSELTPGQGFGVEVLITFILVFCVFASCDKKRKDLNGSTPLTIGFAVSVCHMFAIKYTGSSMNPARSLGPAFIVNRWENHWVYWLGPILGGIIGALLYELVFSQSASMRNLINFFTASDYGKDEYEVTPESDTKKLHKGSAEAAI